VHELRIQRGRMRKTSTAKGAAICDVRGGPRDTTWDDGIGDALHKKCILQDKYHQIAPCDVPCVLCADLIANAGSAPPSGVTQEVL
jgi:hypothetical protein